jgi:membrane protease YdiL (CAAX protease family)
MAVRAITHAAFAWNEELVFRGYGYDVVRAAIGPVAASIVLTALFAAYHPWRVQVLLGEAALGLVLLALRVKSGDIWLPLGYHWAWNVIQTAILGPADGPPSLLPLRVTGPYSWMGRPGYPEPGLLMAGVNLLIAMAIAVSWRRSQGQPGALPE